MESIVEYITEIPEETGYMIVNYKDGYVLKVLFSSFFKRVLTIIG